MPTPIGHALAGTIFYLFSNGKSRKKWLIFLMVLFFAGLPDIDFIFGFFVGNPDKYHHHFTHSLFLIVIAGLIGAFMADKIGVMNFQQSALLFIGAGTSHIFLDILCLDTSTPFGIPIFWPFWEKYFISPVQIFSDVHRTSSSSIFFQSLINWHNLKTVLLEIIIIGPIIIYLLFKRNYSRGFFTE
jgi:membrane-bound metal-dependent hydrolase YbcI (DUF457 family)